MSRPPSLVDAHCHLSSPRLHAPVAEALAQARAAGVTDVVMAGVDAACWQAQRTLAARWPGVYPVYGLHPWVAAEAAGAELAGALATIEAMARQQPRPVAIGETGLDGSTPARRATLGAQQESLRAHLRLARRLGLPVVLHLVRAHDRALRVLKDEGVPPAGGVVHSFSGGAELARRYLDLGLHISLCGGVTRPHARKLRAAAAAVPDDRLLVETDSPDQAPHPHRGAPNRPAWLPLVIAAVAEARGATGEEIGALTAANARRLFGLSAATGRPGPGTSA